jgi:putative NADH-flavin reductase
MGDRVGASWNQKGCGRCDACQSGFQGACASAQDYAVALLDEVERPQHIRQRFKRAS